MTKRYTPISIEKFEKFLGVGDNGKPEPNADWNKNWKFWHLDLQGVFEHTYGMIVAPNITLRIFSSIDINTGESRPEGEDAIRCTLFWKNPASGEIKAIGSTKKVLRMQNWRTNLRKRIEGWEKMIGPNCPDCQSPMVRRKNRQNKNEFYGCVNYPNCRGTSSINE